MMRSPSSTSTPDPEKSHKFYIGLARDGQAFNFVVFRPRKSHMILELRLPENDDLTAKVEQSGIETLEYDKKWRAYRLQLAKSDVSTKADVIKELLRLAYDRWAA